MADVTQFQQEEFQFDPQIGGDPQPKKPTFDDNLGKFAKAQQMMVNTKSGFERNYAHAKGGISTIAPTTQDYTQAQQYETADKEAKETWPEIDKHLRGTFADGLFGVEGEKAHQFLMKKDSGTFDVDPEKLEVAVKQINKNGNAYSAEKIRHTLTEALQGKMHLPAYYKEMAKAVAGNKELDPTELNKGVDKKIATYNANQAGMFKARMTALGNNFSTQVKEVDQNFVTQRNELNGKIKPFQESLSANVVAEAQNLFNEFAAPLYEQRQRREITTKNMEDQLEAKQKELDAWINNTMKERFDNSPEGKEYNTNLNAAFNEYQELRRTLKANYDTDRNYEKKKFDGQYAAGLEQLGKEIKVDVGVWEKKYKQQANASYKKVVEADAKQDNALFTALEAAGPVGLPMIFWRKLKGAANTATENFGYYLQSYGLDFDLLTDMIVKGKHWQLSNEVKMPELSLSSAFNPTRLAGLMGEQTFYTGAGLVAGAIGGPGAGALVSFIQNNAINSGETYKKAIDNGMSMADARRARQNQELTQLALIIPDYFHLKAILPEAGKGFLGSMAKIGTAGGTEFVQEGTENVSSDMYSNPNQTLVNSVKQNLSASIDAGIGSMIFGIGGQVAGAAKTSKILAEGAPNLFTQKMADMIATGGVERANVAIEIMYANGEIDAKQRDTYRFMAQNIQSKLGDAKTIGLTPAQSQAYVAYSQEIEDLKTKAASISDPTLKAAAEKKVEEKEKEAQGVITGEIQLAEIKTETGTTVVTSEAASKAVAQEDMQESVANGEVTITSPDKAVQSKVDEAKQKAAEKAAEPEAEVTHEDISDAEFGVIQAIDQADVKGAYGLMKDEMVNDPAQHKHVIEMVKMTVEDSESVARQIWGDEVVNRVLSLNDNVEGEEAAADVLNDKTWQPDGRLATMDKTKRNNELKRRRKALNDQSKQTEINALLDRQRKYNKMPGGNLGRDTAAGRKELNEIRKEGKRLGFNVVTNRDKTVNINSAKGKKAQIKARYTNTSDGFDTLTDDYKPLRSRSKATNQTIREGLRNPNNLPAIEGPDGLLLSAAQTEKVLHDIRNDIPSKRAKDYLDKLEKMLASGTVDLSDGAGGRIGATTNEYIDTFEDVDFDNWFDDPNAKDPFEGMDESDFNALNDILNDEQTDVEGELEQADTGTEEVGKSANEPVSETSEEGKEPTAPSQKEVKAEQRRAFLDKVANDKNPTSDFNIYGKLPKDKKKAKLDAVAKKVAQAHKDGIITDDDFEKLSQRINADYEALGIDSGMDAIIAEDKKAAKAAQANIDEDTTDDAEEKDLTDDGEDTEEIEESDRKSAADKIRQAIADSVKNSQKKSKSHASLPLADGKVATTSGKKYTTVKEALDDIAVILKGDKIAQLAIKLFRPLIENNPNIKFDNEYDFKGDIAAGWFHEEDGTLQINYKAIGNDPVMLARIILHELVHSATVYEINNNPEFSKKLDFVLDEIREALGIKLTSDNLIFEFVKQGIIDRSKYGTVNEKELLAELFANPEFYDHLKGIKYKGDSLVKQIYLAIIEAISAITGKKVDKPDDMAEYLMQLTEQVLAGKDMVGVSENGIALPNIGGLKSNYKPSKDSFPKAEEMAANGMDAEKIFAETGWYKDDMDGEWKYELPQNNVQYNAPNIKAGDLHLTTLGKVLKFDALYEAYPDLKEIQVGYADLQNPQLKGLYNPADNTIYLNNDSDRRGDTHESTIRHEIQHIIQSKEGFAIGANVAEGKNRLAQEAAQLEHQIETYSQLQSEHVNEAGDNLIKEVVAGLKGLQQSYQENPDSWAYYFYRAYAGEVESRNVQSRMDKATRDQGSPNVTRDKYQVPGHITVKKADNSLSVMPEIIAEEDGGESVTKKSLADKIRGMRVSTNKLYAGLEGIGVAVYNGALTLVANAIEAGDSLANAIKAGVEFIKQKFEADGEKNPFTDRQITTSIKNTLVELGAIPGKQDKGATKKNINQQTKLNAKKGEMTFRELWRRKARNQQQGANIVKDLQKEIISFFKETKVDLKGAAVVKLLNQLVKITNLNNSDTRLEEILDNVDKIIQDQASIQYANGVRAKINKAIKAKSRDLNAATKAIIKDFGKINPGQVENINDYLELAERIIGVATGTKIAVVEGEGVASNANYEVSNAEITDYVEAHEKYVTDLKKERLANAYNKLFEVSLPNGWTMEKLNKIIEDVQSGKKDAPDGWDLDSLEELKRKTEKDMINPAGWTLQELQEIMDWVNGEMDTSKPENDPTLRQAMVIERIKAMRMIVEFNRVGLVDWAMDQDVDGFTNLQVRILEAIKGLDLSPIVNEKTGEVTERFDIKSLAKLNDIINNIIVNGSFVGSGDVITWTAAQKNAETFRDKVRKSGIKLGQLSSSILNGTTSFNLLNEFITKSTKLAAELQRLSGASAIFDGHAKAKIKYEKVVEDYMEFKETLGKDIDSAYNRIARGIYGRMIQNFGGTKEEIQAEFDRNKGLIKQTFETLKTSDDEIEKKEGELIEQVYNDLLKDSNNRHEVMSKISGDNARLVNWWMDRFKANEADLAEHTEVFNNKEFAPVENYTATKYKGLGGVMASEMEDAFKDMFLSKNVDNKSASSKIKRLRNVNLPKNMVLDLDFDAVQGNTYYQTLYDIHTNEGIALARAFYNNADVIKEDVLGSKKNRDVILENLKTAVQMQKHKQPPVQAWKKSAVKAANYLQAKGVRVALGSVSQVLKQYPSVAFNTFGNLGLSKDVALYFKALRIGNNLQLFNEFNIGVRGDTKAGFNREMDLDAIDRANFGGTLKEMTSKIGEWQKKFAESTMTALVKSDVAVARTSWLAYYMQDLKRRGIDIEKRNWHNEHLNPDEEAAAYAEQMVSRTQNPNDASAMADMYKSTKGGLEKVFLNMVMPFNTFSLNMRMRMTNDMQKIIYGGDRTEAVKSLVAAAGEQVVYNAVKVWILGQLTTAGVHWIASLFDMWDDDDEARYKANRKLDRKVVAGVVNDYFFGGLGTGGQAAAQYGMNWLYGNLAEKDAKGRPQKLFYGYDPGKNGEYDFTQWGTYGVAASKVTNMYKQSGIALGGTTTKYVRDGKETVELEVPVTQREKNLHLATFLIDAISVFGAGDAEVSSMNAKFQNILKNKMQEKYGGKQFTITQTAKKKDGPVKKGGSSSDLEKQAIKGLSTQLKQKKKL